MGCLKIIFLAMLAAPLTVALIMVGAELLPVVVAVALVFLVICVIASCCRR